MKFSLESINHSASSFTNFITMFRISLLQKLYYIRKFRQILAAPKFWLFGNTSFRQRFRYQFLLLRAASYITFSGFCSSGITSFKLRQCGVLGLMTFHRQTWSSRSLLLEEAKLNQSVNKLTQNLITKPFVNWPSFFCMKSLIIY